MGSGTDSSPSPELGASLHRLRSTLARLKAELEMAEADGSAPPVARLLDDLDEAFALLRAAEDATQGRGRVLVVDDDTRLAEITARGLRRLGFKAQSAGRLSDMKRDVVLVLDLGLLALVDEATRVAVRAARPIVVTGATDRSSRALAASVAAADYLVKPVELAELAAAINRRMSAP